MNNIFDRCGMTVSGLCGIHCVALIAVSLAQPFITWGSQNLSWLRPLEIAFALAAGAFAVIAFISGFKHHGHIKPVLLGGLGLGMMWGAVFTELHDLSVGPLVSVAGGVCLIIGHKWNIRCRCAHAPITENNTPA